MNRSNLTLTAWLFAAAAALPLAGCQDASAPAATSTQAPQETSAKKAASEESSPKSAAQGKSAEQKPTEETAEKTSAKKDAAPAKAPADQPRVDITFDTIKLDMQKEDPFKMSLITPKIQALEGRRVKVRGYILPSFQQTGLTQFVLVRDNMQCCFGPGAALYDCIVVEMKPGRSTDFTIRPVAVEGIFAVRELLDPDGKTLAIYHLDGEAVQ